MKLLEDRILKANSQLEALGLAYSSKADRIEVSLNGSGSIPSCISNFSFVRWNAQ